MAFTMIERFYIELCQPESPDELLRFHEQIFKTIHDHSEPYYDPLTNGRYRSWVGLSYPLYGKLEQYIKPKLLPDKNLILQFAIKHPGLFIGSTVHLISTRKEALEKLIDSGSLSWLIDDDGTFSEMNPVPSDCFEVIVKRDRRPERRSAKYRLKSTKLFHLGEESLSYQPTTLDEPLPGICNKNNHSRRPIHICQKEASKRVDSWFTIFGLSRSEPTGAKTRIESTVPLIPVRKYPFFNISNHVS